MKERKFLKMFLSFLIITVFSCYSIVAQTVLQPKHFAGMKNTGNNMTLGIPDFAWKIMPQDGDEIGAFSPEGRLIGSAVFNGGNCALTIWGNDETTKSKDGVDAGRRFDLRLWHRFDNSVSQLIVTSWLEGDDVYKVDGISIANGIEIKSMSLDNNLNDLGQNIPNPASSITNIKIGISTSSFVKLVLFTADGKMVRELLAENMEAGEHNVEINVSDLAAGNYYYKMVTPDFTDTKYLNIIR